MTHEELEKQFPIGSRYSSKWGDILTVFHYVPGAYPLVVQDKDGNCHTLTVQTASTWTRLPDEPQPEPISLSDQPEIKPGSVWKHGCNCATVWGVSPKGIVHYVWSAGSESCRPLEDFLTVFEPHVEPTPQPEPEPEPGLTPTMLEQLAGYFMQAGYVDGEAVFRQAAAEARNAAQKGGA